MMQKYIKDVLAVDYHRNGVGGTGFYVVLFTENESNQKMVGIVTPDDPNKWNAQVLSVDKLAENDIAFASNSWRGDVFVTELKDIINKHNETKGYGDRV
jgi:hypothetical protein